MDLLSFYLPKDPNWAWTAPMLNETAKNNDGSSSCNAPSKNQKQKSSRNCRQRRKHNVGSRSRASVSKKIESGKSSKEAVATKTKSKAVPHYKKNRASVKSLPTKSKKIASRSRNHRRRGKRNVGGGKAAISAKPTASTKSGPLKHYETENKPEAVSSQRKAPISKTASSGKGKSVTTSQAQSKIPTGANAYSGIISGITSMEID